MQKSVTTALNVNLEHYRHTIEPPILVLCFSVRSQELASIVGITPGNN